MSERRTGHPLRVGAHVRHTNTMRREGTFGVVEEVDASAAGGPAYTVRWFDFPEPEVCWPEELAYDVEREPFECRCGLPCRLLRLIDRACKRAEVRRG